MIERRGPVELDDDVSRVDRRALWHFLSEQAYWGRWRTREIVEQQLDSAWRVSGAYEIQTGEMVGFARAVSDGHGVAYLADVYTLKRVRGQGIGLAVVDFMINRGPGSEFRWMLHTATAHEFYRQLGFVPPDGTFLERPSPLNSGSASAIEEHRSES